MSLTKNIVVDKIEILEKGQVQVRTATVVLDDNVEIGRSFQRHVLVPGDDISNQDPKVIAIATTAWTPEVISEYQSMIEENNQ